MSLAESQDEYVAPEWAERIIDGAWLHKARHGWRADLKRAVCRRFGHSSAISGKDRMRSSDPVIRVCCRCLTILEAFPGESN